MPSLKKMLHSYDHDLIERISSFWDLDATNLELSTAVDALYTSMQNKALANEILTSLPEAAKEAWKFLVSNKTNIAWLQFTRKYGEVREFGPARREREEPELHPISIAEMLWYRGLIGRAFLNLPPEPREFVFIPDEILKVISAEIGSNEILMVGQIEPSEIKKLSPADGRIIDHMVDWLAARRMNRALPEGTWKAWHMNEFFLHALAESCHLADQEGVPVPDALPAFFQADRSSILEKWLVAWRDSVQINDLKSLSGLVFEGAWQNNPLETRQAFIDLFSSMLPGVWYDLISLITEIKNRQPDFQRSGGDYDAWYIRKAGQEDFLRGFQHWDEVEGALARYFICGPLHWLGAIDLARAGEKNDRIGFRLTALFPTLLGDHVSPLPSAAEKTARITPDLCFKLPVGFSRTLRYQIARFCEIQSVSDLETCYQITPSSLKNAQAFGLRVTQLIQLLEKGVGSPLPKTLLLLAEEWEKTGLAAEIKPQTLLTVASKEILTFLQKEERTSRYLLEILNPTTALINPTGAQTIRSALLEHGWLSEIKLEV